MVRCPRCAYLWDADSHNMTTQEARWRAKAERDLSAAPSVMPPWGERRARTMPEHEIVGTPLLLWRVEKSGTSSECIIGERADGRFMARVMTDNTEHDRAVFVTEGEAIGWALDRELELVAEGWRRVL
jgi:hypothetical protein